MRLTLGTPAANVAGRTQIFGPVNVYVNGTTGNDVTGTGAILPLSSRVLSTPAVFRQKKVRARKR